MNAHQEPPGSNSRNVVRLLKAGRPTSAPMIRNRFFLGLARDRTPISFSQQLRRSAGLNLSLTKLPSAEHNFPAELGSKLPRSSTAKIRSQKLFVRNCGKQLRRPVWTPGKVKPAFSVNAFPLFASLVTEPTPEKLQRAKEGEMTEGTINRMIQARSVEKFMLVKKGTGKVDYSHLRKGMPLTRPPVSYLDCTYYTVVLQHGREEMKDFIKDMRRDIDPGKSEPRGNKLAVSTPALVIQSLASGEIRHVNYCPPRGNLRSKPTSKSSKKPPIVPGKSLLEIQGSTYTTSYQTPKTMTTLANEASYTSETNPWEGSGKSHEDSFSMRSGDSGNESREMPAPMPDSSEESPGSWYSIGINPVVVVRISQGKHIQVSNAGLALDVDSTAVTGRSLASSQVLPVLPEPKPIRKRVHLSFNAEAMSSSPFGTIMKGKKLVETAQPGVRFLHEVDKTRTPNHFLAEEKPNVRRSLSQQNFSIETDSPS